MGVIQDLSIQHTLVSGMFTLPASSAGWERFRLSREQVEFFHENGYVSGVPVLTEEQCDRIVGELALLMDPAYEGNRLFHQYYLNESEDPSKQLFHALGGWRITPCLHDLLWHPAICLPAAQLLGGPVRFWHDQLFCKPALNGGVVAWHQDYSYWTRTQPRAHITCWVSLDDSDVENGGIWYVPGSHRWPLLPITGLAGDMDAVRQVLNPEQIQAFEKRTPVAMKRGECSFHDSLTMHGSYENRSATRARRGAVVNAFRDGVYSTSEEPLMPGTPATPAGSPVGGQFNPLVFDEELYRQLVGNPRAAGK